MDELIKACICGFGYARTSPAMKDRTMDVIIYMKDEEELDIKKGFSDEDTIVCASPITGIDELGEENITISIIISFIRSSSFKEWDRKIKEIPSNYLSSEEERALHVITTAKKRVQKCKKAHLMKQVTAILERAYFSGHVTFMDIPDFKKPMKHDSKPDNWAITSAIKISKKLDDNFFLYNSMNVPKYLSLFFDGGQLTKGENRNISLFYDKKIYPCRIIKIKQYCNLRLYFDLKLVNEIENISKRGKGDVTLVFEKDTKTVDSYKITVR